MPDPPRALTTGPRRPRCEKCRLGPNGRGRRAEWPPSPDPSPSRDARLRRQRSLDALECRIPARGLARSARRAGVADAATGQGRVPPLDPEFDVVVGVAPAI